MKHYLTRCSQFAIILFLVIVTTLHPVAAAGTYSNLYISISDAIMSSKQGDEASAKEAVQTFKENWKEAEVKDSEESKAVDQAIEKALTANSKESRLAALTELSKALTALEKAENPVDEKAERKAFVTTMTPALNQLQNAINEENTEKLTTAYNTFNAYWNKKELPVRQYDVAAYGKIETQMSFIRIELSNDQPNFTLIQDQFNILTKTIQDFGADKKVNAETKGRYSLQSLIDLIDEATSQIEQNDFAKASNTIKELIVTWPNVEGEIRTKNASLYTKIESDMPIIASDLLKNHVDAKEINAQLNEFKQQILLVKEDQNYSFWDSALILLREGLEALLIIIALAAFLKKSNQTHMVKWIYIGAGFGVGLSGVLAILMSTLFQSSSINTSREIMEGYIGLLAAAMMIGIGIWLHSKSNIHSWNSYLTKQLNHAISKQSIWAMTLISFLSVFREGAETLIFYMGIAPKMSTTDFTLGIGVAIAILVVVAFVLLRISGKIPLHLFFAVATILIYVLAFKIIGVSIHLLQLTSTLPTTIVDGLPVWASIGFYPTVQTIFGQFLLIILIILAMIYKKRNAS
ncbi:FTR1 family protein [Ureibacillus sp. NPDC094379]